MVERVVDRGYAWVVICAVYGGFFIQGAVTFTLTLVYQALLERFQMNAADTGSIGAAFTGCFFLSGERQLLSCERYNYFPCRELEIKKFSQWPICPIPFPNNYDEILMNEK